MGRSVLSSCRLLLALLLPPPCSFWMTLSISAISRDRRNPANQDRNRSAPATVCTSFLSWAGEEAVRCCQLI